MTWETYWLPNLLQWSIGPIFTVLISLYLKRLLRLNREQLDRVLLAAEGILGGVRVPSTGRIVLPVASARPPRKDPAMTLARYRKAFGCGAGVLLIGLLTFASTSTELRAMLEQLLPSWAVPLVGVLVGGISAVVAVIKAENAPEPSPYRRAATSPVAVTLPEPAPSTGQRATLAALAPAAGPVPAAGDDVPALEGPMPPAPAADPVSLDPRVEEALLQLQRVGNDTAIVQLGSVPQRDYR